MSIIALHPTAPAKRSGAAGEREPFGGQTTDRVYGGMLTWRIGIRTFLRSDL